MFLLNIQIEFCTFFKHTKDLQSSYLDHFDDMFRFEPFSPLSTLFSDNSRDFSLDVLDRYNRLIIRTQIQIPDNFNSPDTRYINKCIYLYNDAKKNINKTCMVMHFVDRSTTGISRNDTWLPCSLNNPYQGYLKNLSERQTR